MHKDASQSERNTVSGTEALQASFDRFEREQKVRDDGIRRALDIFANEFRRLQVMVGERVTETHQVMESVTDLLTKQNSLLESVRTLIEDRAADEGENWDDPLPAPGRAPGN